jgi:hypothetical protein
LVGTRLNSNWSIEGHYTNFATDTVAVNGSPTAINMSGKSLGVAGLYHFNPQGSYSPFVKLGWHHWDFNLVAVRFHHVVPYLQKSHSETYQVL